MVTIARQGPYELVYDGDKDGLSWGHVKEGSRHLMPPRPLVTFLSHGDWEPVDGGLSAAAVRRVRTPEGERRYGQPIGTIIKRDAPERTVKALIPDAPEFEHAWVSNEDAIREITDVVRKTVSEVFGDELTTTGKYADRYPDGLSVYDRSDAASGFFGLDIRDPYRSHNAGGLLIRIRRKIRLIEGIVHNDYFVVDPAHQDHGLAEALTKNLRDLYIRRGIQRVTVGANIDVGGYAWAKRGFDWPLGTAYGYLLTMKTEDPDLLFQIDKLIERETTGKHVTPVEIAMLGYEKRWTERDTLTGEKREMWFGKEFMLGSSWAGIMRLYPDGADPRIEAMSEEEWARLLSGVLESEGLGPDEVDLPGMIKDIKDKVAEGVTLEQMVSADLFRDEILPKHMKDVPISDEDVAPRGGNGVQQMIDRSGVGYGSLKYSTEGGNLLYQIVNELRDTERAFRGFRTSVHLNNGAWELSLRSDNFPDAMSILVTPSNVDPKRMTVRIRQHLPARSLRGRPVPPAVTAEATEIMLATVEGFGAWLGKMQDAGWREVDLVYRLGPEAEIQPGDPQAFRRVANLWGMDTQPGLLPETLHVTIPSRSGTYRNWQLVEEGDRIHILPPPGVEGREDWWAPSMQSAREMIDLLDLLRPVTSAAVRRVRTPEGAEKYGQPIGSVIKRDSAPIKARIPEVVRWETERQAHAAIVNEVAAVVAEVFGPGVRVRSTTDVDDDFVDLMITGSDRDGLPVEGAIARQIAFYWTTSPPKIMIDNVAFSLNGEQQGKGFGSKVTKALTALYQRSGVVAVRVYANADVGGYAWAKQGFDFQDRTDGLRFRRWLLNLAAQKTAVVRKGEPDWEMWMRVRRDLEPVSDDPTPLELAMAGYAPGLETWPGKEFMLGRSWSGIMYLGWAEAETAAGVRRVRTPEGEKRYGQPIGSIIEKDVEERQVKATLTPVLGTKVKWGDLKVGDRFYDAAGDLQEVTGERGFMENELFQQYGRRMTAEQAVEEGLLDRADYEKGRKKFLRQGKRWHVVMLTGPAAGRWETPDGVSNPDYEFTKIPVPEDPWFQDVVFPVADALKALHEKYPRGIEVALKTAMAPDAGPEPQMSPELKRLMALPEIQRWLHHDIPAAEARVNAAIQALDDFYAKEGSRAEAQGDVQLWSETMHRLTQERIAAEMALVALQADRLRGVFWEHDWLLREHQKEYREWMQRSQRGADPRNPAAQAILADVEAVGAVARERLFLAVKREEAIHIATNHGQSWQWGQLEEARRRLARRLVRSIQQVETSTTQTWPDYAGEYPFSPVTGGKLMDLMADEKAMLTDALLLYPKSWVRRFDAYHDEGGPPLSVSMSGRGFYSTSDNHLSLSTSNPEEGTKDGGDLWTTAVHEIGHGMEKAIPGLKQLESVFWFQRCLPPVVVPDKSVGLEPFDDEWLPHQAHRPTPQMYTLKYYGTVQPISEATMLNPDARRMWPNEAIPSVRTSWEVFTTGVQDVLGNGKVEYTYQRVPGWATWSPGGSGVTPSSDDWELWDMTMGALLSLRPDDGTMKAEEVHT